jgi:exodeoxyribonuclease V
MVGEQLALDLMSFGTKLLIIGDPAQLPPVRGAGYFLTDRPDAMLTDIQRQALESPVLRMATLVREGGVLPFGELHRPMWRIGDDELQAMMLDADQIVVGLNRNRHKVNAAMRSLKGFEGPIPNAGERLLCFRNNHQLGLLNGTMWGVEEACECGRFFRAKLTALDDPEVTEPVVVNIHRAPRSPDLW